jgi:hypothetical protein
MNEPYAKKRRNPRATKRLEQLDSVNPYTYVLIDDTLRWRCHSFGPVRH